MGNEKNNDWKNQVSAKLTKTKAEIEKQIAHLKKNDPFADPEHANDNAAIDTDVREQTYHDTVQAEIDALQSRMEEVDLAISKVEKNQYGYCGRCGKDIPPARLELVPEAQYCVDCENQVKK